MSFADEIIDESPNKYESILQNRIVSSKLKLKINEYNTLQNTYDNFIPVLSSEYFLAMEITIIPVIKESIEINTNGSRLKKNASNLSFNNGHISKLIAYRLMALVYILSPVLNNV